MNKFEHDLTIKLKKELRALQKMDLNVKLAHLVKYRQHQNYLRYKLRGKTLTCSPSVTNCQSVSLSSGTSSPNNEKTGFKSSFPLTP